MTCLLLALCALPASRAVLPAAGRAAQEETYVYIELNRMRLTVYKSGQSAGVFPIAAGARDTPSPIGTFTVNRKFRTEMSGFGTRFLGLNVPWGQYGIHGTNRPDSLGQNASHGCIRLSVRDAEQVYRLVPAGTRVTLDGGPFGPLGNGPVALRPGDRSSQVYEMQRRLILRGALWGEADGVYGTNTSRAVARVRREMGMPPSDEADAAFLSALGVMAFE